MRTVPTTTAGEVAHMVAERIVSHADQAALCVLAKAGDADAANRLALAVWPWVRRKAGEYGRRYRTDPDDLEAVGLARLPYAVRSYDPTEGTFLNYFANCAAREMLSLARDESARQDGQVGLEVSNDDGDQEEVVPQRRPLSGARDERVRSAVESLDPLSRQIVLAVLGWFGEPVTIREAGRSVGLTNRRTHRLYKAALASLSELLG